ncbi:MAG TPA: type II toxin-antitoxin system YoeB family toxin [Phycicoccus sp.]|nr:type II toxin-antitoxin system YoeB family toxin [Phycicoccus sp.]
MDFNAALTQPRNRGFDAARLIHGPRANGDDAQAHALPERKRADVVVRRRAHDAARSGLHWSRRITDEHRLVYKVTDGELRLAACRYHYGK